jgi:predicted CoA-binding protein
MNEPETIRFILESSRTIAVVGLSDNQGRPSYGVARYMQAQGYRIIPVNPEIESSLGEKAYPSLDAACAALETEGINIDLVDVFRASVFVPEIVKDVMRLKIPALWLQEGVCHEEAAEWAEKDGIKVVMDRCILKDYAAKDHAARNTRPGIDSQPSC